MELLVTKISILQMFGYGDLFKLLNTELLVNRDVLLLLVLIKYPSDSVNIKSLTSSCPTVKCFLIFSKNHLRN